MISDRLIVILPHIHKIWTYHNDIRSGMPFPGKSGYDTTLQ